MAEENKEEEIRVPVLSTPVNFRYELKKPLQKLELKTPAEYKSLFEEISIDEPSIWEMMWFLITKAPKLVYLLVKILLLLEDLKMNKDKITNITAVITAIIGAIVTVIALFGITIPPEVVNVGIGTIVAIATAVLTVLQYYTGKSTK